MPASSRRQFLKEAKLLLLLRDLAGLLRSLLHCALRLLRLLSFLGHVALLMLSEMALVAACTRESKCTTSRIHQRIQKNSFPLKEVLTQQCESARSSDVGDFATCSRIDAETTEAMRIIAGQYCRNRLHSCAFLNLRRRRSMNDRCHIDSATASKCRAHGL